MITGNEKLIREFSELGRGKSGYTFELRGGGRRATTEGKDKADQRPEASSSKKGYACTLPPTHI
jgi:hypothetical protein